jgi:hypothetical protein
MFGLAPNYDWKEDPEHLESKDTQTLALAQMKEIVRTTTVGLNYTYLTDFIGSEANIAFINTTAMPEIVNNSSSFR